MEGCRSGAAAVFGCVKEVGETAAGREVVSEVDGASRLSVQLEQQTDALFLEWCCLVHAGLTDISSGLKVEVKGRRSNIRRV